MIESEVLMLMKKNVQEQSLPEEDYLGERLRKVIHLRKKEKRTFRYIGNALGISYTRAQQLYDKALAKIKEHEGNRDSILAGFSVRIKNCLKRQNLRDEESIIAAIKSGKLHPNFTRNYGWVSHRQVCKKLGLPEPRKTDSLNRGSR